MTSDDHTVEVLAQALWMKAFGEKRILPEWQAWAGAHAGEADILREKARGMIGTARPQGPDAPPRPGHHHGLGWLLGS